MVTQGRVAGGGRRPLPADCQSNRADPSAGLRRHGARSARRAQGGVFLLLRLHLRKHCLRLRLYPLRATLLLRLSPLLVSKGRVVGGGHRPPPAKSQSNRADLSAGLRRLGVGGARRAQGGAFLLLRLPSLVVTPGRAGGVWYAWTGTAWVAPTQIIIQAAVLLSIAGSCNVPSLSVLLNGFRERRSVLVTPDLRCCNCKLVIVHCCKCKLFTAVKFTVVNVNCSLL